MRLPLLAMTLVAVAVLAACGPAPGRFRPEMTVAPVDAPLFASDAEALAAAEEVYREYFAVANGGGTSADIETLRPYVSESWLQVELDGRRDFEARGVRVEGQPNLLWMRLQQHEAGGVKAYVCLDLSPARLLDSAGLDVTPEDRGQEALLLVTLVQFEHDLVIDGSALWSKSCS